MGRDSGGRATPAEAGDARRRSSSRVRGQGYRETTIQPHGYVYLHGIKFQISSKLSGLAVHAVWDETSVAFADPNGEVLIEHHWPPKGTTYVSNGIRRGRPSK